MRRGFVTAGTWCLDRNITVDFWPREDMAATARDVALAGGGSGCNFAVDMKRLDPAMPVETQSVVGDDAHGDFLIGVADAHGIDRRFMRRIEGAGAMVSDAYLSAATGRRTHLLFEGVGALMSPEHFDFSGTTARVMHLGLPGIHAKMDAPWGDDANGWVTVLKAARAAGLRTDMELVAAPDETLRRICRPCLPHLDTLVVNDHEIGALAGRPAAGDPADAASVLEAARAVIAMGAMELVAAHFTEGAVLVSRDGAEIVQPSVAVPEAERRGANGAGDAFSAGFHYALHEGWPAADCLRLGHAAAAASLRAADTYSAVESADACLALAARWGWRSV
jgi:sugar/nucleoside kinase (ribokinase family)